MDGMSISRISNVKAKLAAIALLITLRDAPAANVSCTAQWKLSSNDLGPTSGGFLAACNSGTHAQKSACVREKCNKLPDGNARKGCLWFVDWYQIADNPNFRYEPINCPSDL